MENNLISNQNYIYYILTRYKKSYEDYDNFLCKNVHDHIDLKPYLYTLSLQTPKDIQKYKIFFASYLVKSGMMEIENMGQFFKDPELFINKSDDLIISCIICMQYYFL